MDERSESRGFTRGGMIKVGAAAALAVGVGATGRALAGDGGFGAATGSGVGIAPSGLRKPSGGPAYLRHESFVPLVGSEFRVRRPDVRTLRVKLIEARRGSGVGESFSLLFRGPAGTGLEAGMFRLEHPALGEFELFAGPVGRGVKGLDLEAVINRIET